MPGRVILTNLFRTLTPISRYPVGDRAEWSDPDCRTFRILGRTNEGALVGGVAVPTEEVRAGAHRGRPPTGTSPACR